MKLKKNFLIAILTALVLVPSLQSSADSETTRKDGIAASPKVRQMLDERAAAKRATAAAAAARVRCCSNACCSAACAPRS